MADSSDDQVSALLASVTVHSGKHKGEYVEKIGAATRNLLVWLEYLSSSVSRKSADRLLDATQAAIIETAGCLSLGLVRPAIFSIRVQLELVLAWIYFNDHPIEWGRFETTGIDYQLPAAALKYLRNNSDRYHDRFEVLSKNRRRVNIDPYAILSIHVHSNSPYSAPTIGPLSALVRPEATCEECVGLQQEVVEFVTDVLASWYADKWHDLPSEIKSELRKRMTGAALKEFCK